MYTHNLIFKVIRFLIIASFCLSSYKIYCGDSVAYNERDIQVPRVLKAGVFEEYMPDFTQEIEPLCIEKTNYITFIKMLSSTPFRINLIDEGITAEELEKISSLSSTLYGLDLSDNYLDKKILKSLSLFVELRFLNLAGNHLKDDALEFLSPLNKLNHLILTYNKITANGLEFLLNFNNLECLDISSIYWDERFLSIIPQFTKLKGLNVSLCNLDDRHLDCFTKMGNLKHINISGNNFNSDALRIFLDHAQRNGLEVKF